MTWPSGRADTIGRARQESENLNNQPINQCEEVRLQECNTVISARQYYRSCWIPGEIRL